MNSPPSHCHKISFFFCSIFFSLLRISFCCYSVAGRRIGRSVEAFATPTVGPIQRSYCRNRSVKTMKMTTMNMNGGGREIVAAAAETDDQVLNDTCQSNDKPLFSMGLIADIQYAPIPDGFSYTGNPRYYMHALEVAQHAFQHFQSSKVDIVTNLGDTIDGKCQDVTSHGGEWPPPQGDDQEQTEHPPHPGRYALSHVVDAMAAYNYGPIVHTYGNHCLYNLDRTEIEEHIGIPFVREDCTGTENWNGDDGGEQKSEQEKQQKRTPSSQQSRQHAKDELVGYYSHHIKLRDGTKSGILLVVIDWYDIAMMKRCDKSSQKYKAAVKILKENNPLNFEKGEINSPAGLEGLQRRFVAFNGAVGATQLLWLTNTLQDARRGGHKVIIMSHNPIHPDSSNPVCLLWNYDEVLAILRQYSDVVVASFAGHAHKGGYCRDEESGIHFRVLEAALENKPHKTYGILDVFYDVDKHMNDGVMDSRWDGNSSPKTGASDVDDGRHRLVLRGFGNCESAVFDFGHTFRQKATVPL